MPRKKKLVKRRQYGRGVMDKVLDDGHIFGFKIPELHLRGFSGKYNFAGPFTKLKNRIDDYGNPLAHSKPINEVDRIAMQHDIDYELGVKKEDADRKMIASLDKMKPKNWRERLDRALVRGAIRLKQMTGFGRKGAALSNPRRRKKTTKRRKLTKRRKK